MDIKDIHELLKREIKFIYIITKEVIWDYDKLPADVYLFTNCSDALKKYNELIIQEKTNYKEEMSEKYIEMDETKILEKEFAKFNIWKEGYPDEYDTIITLEKKEVK